jgi:hypothetical protein
MREDLIRELTSIHVSDREKILSVSRQKANPSGALSPCEMTPDDVDYEMSFPKDKRILEICGMNQESFEYFVEKYGESYEALYFFKCQLISDFSPLSKLKNLKAVIIWWNIRSMRLWDMSENSSLKQISINDCKKITGNLGDLATSKTLEDVSVYGSIFNNFVIESLDPFKNIPSLRELTLRNIALKNRSIDFLKDTPNLTEFNFDSGMLTTEQIAYICARYPHIKGTALCAYNKKDAILSDVRICGYRKPGLNLPEGQKRLEKYIREFDALVEKYKTEELE